MQPEETPLATEFSWKNMGEERRGAGPRNHPNFSPFAGTGSIISVNEVQEEEQILEKK